MKEKRVKSRRSSILAVLLIVVLSFVLGCTRVEPGYVGIKVNYGGGDRGVQDFPAVTGWVFYAPGFSTVFEWPTFMQTAVWTRDKEEGSESNEEITFNTKEGLVVSGDISLSYQLLPQKVPAFYVKFRTDDLDVFTHGFLRNVARDAFNEVGSRYTVEQVYGEKKEEFLKNVRDLVNSQVLQYGVFIQQFGFTGAMRIPSTVKSALDAKIQAIQDAIRAENQVRQAEAEAKQKIARAEGEAIANQKLAASITPQLLEWRRLAISEQTVSRWNGVRPQVEGAGANLLFSIK